MMIHSINYFKMTVVGQNNSRVLFISYRKGTFSALYMIICDAYKVSVTILEMPYFIISSSIENSWHCQYLTFITF